MKSFRALLPLLSSLILCMFVWTSDVHALSMTVSNGINTPVTFGFTSVASTTPGCLSGFACSRISNWTPGTTTFLNAPSTGTPWLKLTTGAGFTSGPIVSVKNTNTSAGFGLNGGIFQGFSSTSGSLTITLAHDFSALGDGARSFGLIESGAFLSGPGATVTSDTLSMTGAVNNTNFAQILKTATAGLNDSPYNLTLSPSKSIAITDGTAPTNLKYTWVYNYNNSGHGISSQFSDPLPQGLGTGHGGDGLGHCKNHFENCVGAGGSLWISGTDAELALYNRLVGGTNSSGQLLSEAVPNTVPEPSSLLFLGLGLLIVGLFFAPRLKKERATR